jgi:hypothetical protein
MWSGANGRSRAIARRNFHASRTASSIPDIPLSGVPRHRARWLGPGPMLRSLRKSGIRLKNGWDRYASVHSISFLVLANIHVGTPPVPGLERERQRRPPSANWSQASSRLGRFRRSRLNSSTESPESPVPGAPTSTGPRRVRNSTCVGERHVSRVVPRGADVWQNAPRPVPPSALLPGRPTAKSRWCPRTQSSIVSSGAADSPQWQDATGWSEFIVCTWWISTPTEQRDDTRSQGRTIHRAVRKVEIDDDVPNHGLPKEVRVGAHAKGQARRAKSQRNRPGLRVGPKEDSNLTRMLDLSGVEKALDLGSHEECLIQLVTGGIDSSARPLSIAGPGFTATLEWSR